MNSLKFKNWLYMEMPITKFDLVGQWNPDAKWIENYRMEHEAPDKDNGSPMYNVSLNGIYPEDFYSSKSYQYGDGTDLGNESISIILSARNKPNARIKIYRAIPAIITYQDKINDLENQKRYILKYGKIPIDIRTNLDKSGYYEFISNELDKLKKSPIAFEKKPTINIGDWVTINKRYAIEHGKNELGRYKIISKTVFAKNLYTDGNSVHEWGYNI
jgi:hypothetical protein